MSPERKREPFVGDPLPRGRHKLSPETVRASQRERLLNAMLDLVGTQGYAETTVPQVVANARVSRTAFYELFADKTECFLALCDEEATHLIDELLALAEEPDWVRAVSRGMRIYLDWWKDRPAFSRAYFLELPSAGPRAIEQRARAQERFVDLFRALAARARAEETGLPEASDLGIRILVGGITDLVAEEVRAGRVARLRQLETGLVHITVRALADDATAERVAASLDELAA